MAPAGRYLALAVFIAACFTLATCKTKPSQPDDDTLYFRQIPMTEGVAETNDENRETDVSAETDFLEILNPAAVDENILPRNQKTDDASENHIPANQDPETNIPGNLKTDDAKETEDNTNIEEDNMKTSIEVGKPNSSILHVPWWPSFLLSLVNSFNHQRVKERSQFSVLYMGNEYIPNQDQFPLNFYPSNQDGTPVINNNGPLSPTSRSDYVNYVAARPQQVPYECSMIHTKFTILDEMKHLWNSYQTHYGHPPNMIVLYSWIMPCPECTEEIIDYLNKAPFSDVPFKVIVYKTEGTNSSLTYMTPEGNTKSRQRLTDNGITYWKQQCERPEDLAQHGFDKSSASSAESHVCKLSDTFQGCFVGCLGKDFCCSCKESRKMSMNAAIVNDLVKDCATTDMKTCARSWVQTLLSDQRSGASSCTDLASARAKLLSCADTCVGRPLSKPLNPLNPSVFPGSLVKFSDIRNFGPVTFSDFCTDIRAEGYLCYNYRADAFTAGNSLCKTGSVCGYSGYSYKWCYTIFGSWDYCCTSGCSYGTKSYRWCHSGSTWQYCGDAGDNTVKNKQCLAKFPCGMHQEKGKENYYWCYTDTNKNWGYCCQPGDTCSKKGLSHDWCYTGYKKKSTPQSCTK